MMLTNMKMKMIIGKISLGRKLTGKRTENGEIWKDGKGQKTKKRKKTGNEKMKKQNEKQVEAVMILRQEVMTGKFSCNLISIIVRQMYDWDCAF